MPNLSIIIPHYNTPDALQRLLAALGTAYPVIVVDNASDEKVTVPEGVMLIENAYNAGFAHAANQGAAQATTEFLLFLNPDIEISENQIQQLVAQAQQKQWVATSPWLTDTDGKIQRAYHQPRPHLFTLIQEYTPLKNFPSLAMFSGKTVLPGACLLMKRSVLEELGGWSEQYWLWWEDVDLSERLYEGEYRLGVSKKVRVLHQGGASFSPLSEKWRRNIFFHSLHIFVGEHWEWWSRGLTHLLTRRFLQQRLYQKDEQLVASVVVPNMRAEILEEFLQKNLQRFDFARHELVVVTSASPKEVWKWRAEYPQIVFVSLGENRGFAHTVNTGFRRARGQYLITVNDDTILPPNWIDSMVKRVKRNTGSVSPLVVSPQGEVESLGVDVLPRGKAVPLTESNGSVKPKSFNAAAILLTRSAVEKVGLFDERFGSYLEDIDLGLRMSRAGFQHEICPDVKIVHHKHQTAQHFPVRKAWQDVKNWWLVVVKNTSLWEWFLFGGVILLERMRNLSGFLKALGQ